MKVLSGVYPVGTYSGRHLGQRRRPGVSRGKGGGRSRDRDHLPGAFARKRTDGRRKHLSRQGTVELWRHQLVGAVSQGDETPSGPAPFDRSAHTGRKPRHRAAAARGNRQGPFAGSENPRARRADGGADRIGGRNAVYHPSQAQGARRRDDLYLAQAGRSVQNERPDHRSARRQDGRDARRGRPHKGKGHLPDGRARRGRHFPEAGTRVWRSRA